TASRARRRRRRPRVHPPPRPRRAARPHVARRARAGDRRDAGGGGPAHDPRAPDVRPRGSAPRPGGPPAHRGRGGAGDPTRRCGLMDGARATERLGTSAANVTLVNRAHPPVLSTAHACTPVAFTSPRSTRRRATHGAETTTARRHD